MSNRSLLVKVIVSNDSANRDEIIRATNNQTIVELASLHATDKIQRDIEEVLKLNDLYYERRTNYYKNQGIPLDKIFTPLYLASGYVSLILKHPEQATNLKSKFMRKESSYNKVFSTKTDLNVWPKITSILKQTDKFLETKRPNVNSSSEHFLKNRRQYLSFLTVSRLCGSFNFTIQELINFDLSLLTMEEFEITWELMKKSISTLSSKSKIARTVLLDICRKMNNDNSIKGFERIVSETLPDLNIINSKKYKRQGTVSVTNEFVESVEMILPKQPWKPGTHKEVANKLDCSENEIYLATNILIEAGKLYKQKDGILYDKDGKIVDFDVERVNPETFRLKE